MDCKLCEQPAEGFGSLVVLGRHHAEYRRCRSCGYVFVADPHWLQEAYARAISGLDTGIVTRHLWLADASAALLRFSLRNVGPALDYGGGTGLFVRLMRDRGFDFHWRDRYSPNLLAIGFEAPPAQRFDLVTCFEVIEHLPDPMAGFADLAALAPTMLVSTELLPEPAPRPGDWWYYAAETGQHIGFFTRAALAVVGERLGLRVSSNGRNLHVLSPETVSEPLLRWLRKPRRAALLGRLARGRARAHADSALLLARLRAQQSPDPSQ